MATNFMNPPEENLSVSPAEDSNQELSQEQKSFFKDLLSKCELEDQSVHNAHVRKVRRLELYFNNIVTLFWDNVAHDWRIPDWDELEADGVPPRIINRYRPHAESIIAALSERIPGTVFFPADANNPDDIDTANNYSTLSRFVNKHVKAQLLFIKAITLLFNNGTIFGYNYFKRDKKFGFYHVEQDNYVNESYYTYSCPDCGFDYGEGLELPAPINCPDCNSNNPPETEQGQRQVNQPIQIQKEKGRPFIELFGVTNVKVPYSARSQEQIGYLILKFDQSVAFLRSIYCVPGPNGEPALLENIEPSQVDTSMDSWVRFPTIYNGTQPENTAIVKCVWYRPWQLRLIKNADEVINEINQLCPEGCYVIYINDEPVEFYPENLDEHWTISQDPRSASIHGEPLGTGLAEIQDISAEVDELELQLMEHGIPETYVASDALNWAEYKDIPAAPGNRIPAFKEAGKSLSEQFFETRPASMSPELQGINGKYNDLAEFVTGDFPTIYGGPSQGGGETATAYTKSQNRALQRLGPTWKIISNFWTSINEKAVREYASYLEYDETQVERSGQSFQNLTVSPDGLKGQIGRAEPENDEQLPVSWAQIKDLIVQLMTMKDPLIMSVLTHPQNNQLMKKATGLHELYIPGEEDRNKQYREIRRMLTEQPIQQMVPGNLNGVPLPPSPQLMSSVEPEPFDDDKVHAEICVTWLNSSEGEEAKYKNPMGRQNVILHWQLHNERLMQKAREEMQANASKESESPKENGN